MTYTLSTYFLLSYFNTTTVANYTLIANTLILTAGTFVILYRTEDTLTKQTITLWFVGTVVNGFGFEHLAMRSLQKVFWRGKADSDALKVAVVSAIIVFP